MKSIGHIFKGFVMMLLAIVLQYFACCSQPGPNTSKTPISEKEFNSCFPLRNKFYTYNSFVKAISDLSSIHIKIEKRGNWIYKITRTNKKTGKAIVVREDKEWNEAWALAKPYSSIELDYSHFCTNMTGTANKKELAAFFAHVAHETRNGTNNNFNDGLMLLSESNTDSSYVIPNLIYPAVEGKKYYGRGPMQLSYNGNYGFASTCIFGDKNILLEKPELITNNPVIAFKTAIYFWMTPQSLKPSAHDVIIGNWKPTATESQNGYQPGFGMTINIINGQVECNKGNNVHAMNDRIRFYQYFLMKFKISDPNCFCSCANMAPIGS